MIKSLKTGVIFILMILLGVSCQSGLAGKIQYPYGNAGEAAALMSVLGSGQEILPEQPFSLRPFHPYIGDDWIGNAAAYGCYRRGQAPGVEGPDRRQILEDLQIISKYWHLIRVYNADDDTENILKVIRKHKLPVKMMLGVWLANEEDHSEVQASNIRNTLRSIELANEYNDIVIAVNVGNETQVFWSAHRMNPDNLIRYIRAVRNHVNVPVTTADDYNFWNKPESRAVAAEVDFITTHMHPVWNGKQVEESFEWAGEIYDGLSEFHPGREFIIGEIGWATDYNADKTGDGQQGALIKGEMSAAAQARYLKLHHEWVNEKRIPTFIFEVFDEPWKGGGVDTPPHEVEKHWGVFDENRRPKTAMDGYERGE